MDISPKQLCLHYVHAALFHRPVMLQKGRKHHKNIINLLRMIPE